MSQVESASADHRNPVLQEKELSVYLLLASGWRINDVTKRLECSRPFVQRVAHKRLGLCC